tara:strand:- start:486 stop:920 length:435 start_codon:yes stop_codon:yes gene_type:complete
MDNYNKGNEGKLKKSDLKIQKRKKIIQNKIKEKEQKKKCKAEKIADKKRSMTRQERKLFIKNKEIKGLTESETWLIASSCTDNLNSPDIDNNNNLYNPFIYIYNFNSNGVSGNIYREKCKKERTIKRDFGKLYSEKNYYVKNKY